MGKTVRKSAREVLESGFAALRAELQKDPTLTHDTVKFVRAASKEFGTASIAAYRAGVSDRKAQRDERRALKAEALAEARKLKDEAQAKFAAALAISVNGKAAARRAKKVQNELDIAIGQVDPTEATGALADLVETAE